MHVHTAALRALCRRGAITALVAVAVPLLVMFGASARSATDGR